MNNKMIFKVAKRRFFESGKMLESMLAFSMVLFSFVLPLIAADILRMLLAGFGLDELTLAGVFYAIVFLVLVTVSMPMLIGYYRFLYAIYKCKKDICVADVFSSFSSPLRYSRAVAQGTRVLRRLLVIFGIPFFIALSVYFGAVGIAAENISPFLATVFKAFSIGVFFVIYIIFLLISSEGYLGLYNIVIGNDKPYVKSRKLLRGRILRTFSLKLTFLLTVVVSLLSVGSLFLVTAPIMANAYFIYSEQITEKIND